ncbi:Aste57867_3971 [Aphanomyces stellatus]|uniref:Aste57867_3971 protein n=1 Tax=Aphanomyces stellatus TaxID=120398 RepID=A0A485KEL6_9STRA|nr:hypothetical protein As57867_003960 [Aphanomyces stellatus]VFT81108.1 Aste57867_3971 [Aphanomyces stellatus]
MSSRNQASVPFMITAKMKYELKTLGYTDDDIYKVGFALSHRRRRMKVDDAHEILDTGLRKGEKKKVVKAGGSILAGSLPTLAALVVTLVIVYLVFF